MSTKKLDSHAWNVLPFSGTSYSLIVCLMPRDASRRLKSSIRGFLLCVHEHWPALDTVPSVSISPRRSSILCSTLASRYISGMRLSPHTPRPRIISLASVVNPPLGFGTRLPKLTSILPP